MGVQNDTLAFNAYVLIT